MASDATTAMEQATTDPPQPSAKRPAESPTTPQPNKSARKPIVLSSALSKTAAISYSDALGKGHTRNNTLEGPVPFKFTFKGARDKPPKGSLLEAVDKTLLEGESSRRARREVLTTTAMALDKALEPYDSGPRQYWAIQAKNQLRAALLQLADTTTQNCAAPAHESEMSKQHAAKHKTSSNAAPPTPPAETKAPPPIPARTGGGQQQKKDALRPAPQRAANGPTRPTIPTPVNENEWTTVTGKRQLQKQGQANRPDPQNQRSDDRIFLRIPDSHPWRSATPTEMRVSILDITGLALTDIKEVQKVRTGFAVRTTNPEATERLQHPWPVLEKEGTRFEPAQLWHTYVVANVPRTINGYRGSKLAEELILDEIKAASGVDPISCRPSKHQDPNSLTQDWVISFTERVKPGFRAFGSKPARRIDRKAQITQCLTCWDFHDPRNCDRTPRCGQCGSPSHPDGQVCEGTPRCANCHAPHRADSQICPARPKREKGQIVRPTKKQLQSLRQIGARASEEARKRGRPEPGKTPSGAALPATGPAANQPPLQQHQASLEPAQPTREPSVAPVPTPTPVPRTTTAPAPPATLQRTKSVHGRHTGKELNKTEEAPPLPPIPEGYHPPQREPTRTVSPPPDSEDESEEDMDETEDTAVQC